MVSKTGLWGIPWFLALLLLLIALAFMQLSLRTPIPFYAQQPDGTTTTITALERPNVSTKMLLNWATMAATATFSFDFVHTQKQLEALKDYFTNDGYTGFVVSLENNKSLETIQEKKLVSSAVATGPAIVLSEETVGLQQAWRIQVPILVRYQSANVNTVQQQIIEMLVVQVSTRDAPKGIGIAQYIAWNAESEV